MHGAGQHACTASRGRSGNSSTVVWTCLSLSPPPPVMYDSPCVCISYYPISAPTANLLISFSYMYYNNLNDTNLSGLLTLPWL